MRDAVDDLIWDEAPKEAKAVAVLDAPALVDDALTLTDDVRVFCDDWRDAARVDPALLVEHPNDLAGVDLALAHAGFARLAQQNGVVPACRQAAQCPRQPADAPWQHDVFMASGYALQQSLRRSLGLQQAGHGEVVTCRECRAQVAGADRVNRHPRAAQLGPQALQVSDQPGLAGAVRAVARQTAPAAQTPRG